MADIAQTAAPQAAPVRPSKRLGLPAKLGFGAGDFAINIYWQGVSLFLLFFYTDMLGISPAVAGLLYLIAMVWDGISDPVMGALANHARSRWGRYRPFLLFGSVPLAVSFALLFFKPDLGPTAMVVYALIVGLLFRTCYTVVSIPYSSLSARITNDSLERSQIAGFRMVFAAAGGLTVSFFGLTAIQNFSTADPAAGFTYAAVLGGIAATAILALCFTLVKEPPLEAETGEQFGENLRAVVRAVRHNTPFWLVFFSILIISVSTTMLGKNILYYFKYDLEMEAEARWALLVLAGSWILFVPFWVVVTKWTSKRHVWLIGAALSSAALFVFYLNDTRDLQLILLNLVFVSFGTACFGVTFWSMVPDTVEYGQWRTGVRSESFVFGFVSLAQKVALGIGAGLLGLLLGAVGFEANVAQSDATLDGIKAIMTLIPMIGILLSAVLIYFYPIDQAMHAQLVAEIEGAAR